MYRTSKKPAVVKESSASSFNICGIEGFLVLFLALSLPLLMAAFSSSGGPSNIERALAKAPLELRGLTVSCDYAMDFERKCRVGKTGDTFGRNLTLAVPGDEFPASYFVYLDEAGDVQVRTPLRPEMLDLATAQARLSKEVQSVVAQYLEREQVISASPPYRALSEAEQARNLASYPES